MIDFGWTIIKVNSFANNIISNEEPANIFYYDWLFCLE